MNKLLPLFLLGALCASPATAQKIKPSTKPNACQQEMIDRGYGMFIHYGMNTFNQAEWSEGTDAPSVYNPTELDCDQWIKVAKDAGFRYVILTTKHHDGFCLWDSKYTDYDVASSPVKTDVVKAVSDACKKYGIGLGLYYSQWDRHEPTFKDEKNFGKYIDFMENQLTELLTNYGDVCEIWFDGGWEKDAHEWQIDRIYNHVKKLQPGCAVGVNVSVLRDKPEGSDAWFDKCADPEDMVEGNDSLYLRYFPMDFRMRDPYIAHPNDQKIYNVNGKKYYLPFEQTVCISRENAWFQKTRPVETHSLDHLEEMFYWATANDNVFVINVPPDARGKIRENEIQMLLALRDRVGIEPGKKFKKRQRLISLNVPSEATSEWDTNYTAAKAFDGGWATRWASREETPQLVCALDPNEEFNRISIIEYTDQEGATETTPRRFTNRITQYTIDAFNNGQWEVIYTSTEPMGDCKVINFARPIKAEKLRLNVLSSIAPPSIHEFSVYAPEGK